MRCEDYTVGGTYTQISFPLLSFFFRHILFFQQMGKIKSTKWSLFLQIPNIPKTFQNTNELLTHDEEKLNNRTKDRESERKKDTLTHTYTLSTHSTHLCQRMWALRPFFFFFLPPFTESSATIVMVSSVSDCADPALLLGLACGNIALVVGAGDLHKSGSCGKNRAGKLVWTSPPTWDSFLDTMQKRRRRRRKQCTI